MNVVISSTFLFSLLIGGTFGHQQVISVLPQGVVGYGGQQSVYSTLPLTGTGQQFFVQGQQQPSYLQYVRQQPYGINTGGLTQFVGQPGVGQLVAGGQLSPSGVGQVLGNVGGFGGVTQPLVISTNGMGLTGTSTGLPYPYSLGGFTTANINGVQVLVASSPSALAGLGLNGLQSLSLQSQFLQQQPLVAVNPVVRQVSEEEEEEIDPMDAALLEMENKGQMHMEKYAWGRQLPTSPSLEKASTLDSNSAPSLEAKEPRSAGMPYYYNPLPQTLPVPVRASSPPPSRGRNPSSNPFVDGSGKRKKHFELYQYFRNLDLNSPQILVPVTA